MLLSLLINVWDTQWSVGFACQVDLTFVNSSVRQQVILTFYLRKAPQKHASKYAIS